jgi:hypothetical protein
MSCTIRISSFVKSSFSVIRDPIEEGPLSPYRPFLNPPPSPNPPLVRPQAEYLHQSWSSYESLPSRLITPLLSILSNYHFILLFSAGLTPSSPPLNCNSFLKQLWNQLHSLLSGPDLFGNITPNEFLFNVYLIAISINT